MLVIIGIVLSLLETKEALRDNKLRASLFMLFIVIVLLLYIFQDKIPSIMNIITKIKELLDE